MIRTRTKIRLAAVPALAIAAALAPAAAQVPDKFTNLKVLPADISKEDLLRLMQSFSFGLDVRCNYCHAGRDDLKGTDFAADDKPTKRTARVMLRMVNEINGHLMKGIETERAKKIEVTCQTCHHGVAVPEPVEDIVARAIDEKGMDGAIADYRELRKKQYGTGAYDFSEVPLNRLARTFMAGKKLDQALALVQLGIEYNPKAVWSRNLLGSIYKARGETAEAIGAFKQALELNPDNAWAKKQIEALSGSQEKGAEASPGGQR